MVFDTCLSYFILVSIKYDEIYYEVIDDFKVAIDVWLLNSISWAAEIGIFN